MQVTQYPKNADGTPMDLLVGVLTDASGNGGARLTDVPVGPDKAPIDAVGLVLVDSGGVPATPLTAAMFVASVAEMKTTNPVPYPQLFLTENGRAGLFTKQVYAANVAMTDADVASGIAVRSTQNPNYVWIRQFDGPVNPAWFGLAEANTGAANSDAIETMQSVLRTRAVNISANYQGIEPIEFPGGDFDVARTIEFTDGSGIVSGASIGRPAGHGTKLTFPLGVTGFRVHSYNTSGATGDADVPTHRGGQTTIRGFSLTGAYVTGNAEAEAHGVQLRGQANLENLFIDLFEGDGIYSNATVGNATNEGNANVSYINGCRAQRCRTGLFVDGADVNIISVIACDFTANRTWGVNDSSFLGNSYFGCHAATNGWVESTKPTATTFGGNRYYVMAGQAAAASVTAPSGTTASTAEWGYIGAGGVFAGIVAWVSGTVFREGGSYKTDNANARNAFFGCYTEGDQNPSQMVAVSLCAGGNLAQDVIGTGGTIYTTTGGYLATKVGYRASIVTAAGSTLDVTLGESSASLSTILQVKDSLLANNIWRFKVSGNDLVWNYQNSNTLAAYWITGPATAQQFGTGAIVAHAFYPPKLMVGDTIANARQISNGTVLPVANAHGAGELVINRTPAVGGIGAWICRTAGTPGTWEAFGIVGAVRSAAPAVTYAAPAATYVAASGGTTIDTQARASQVQLAADVAALRASLAQLAVDNADLRTKLAAANLTA